MNTVHNHISSFWRALFAMGLSVLFWSSVPLLLKYFTHVLDTWSVNGMRYLFSASFWLPYVLKHVRETDRKIWTQVIPPATAHVIGQIFFGIAPYYNDATIINFVSRVSFLFTTLFGFSLLRDERPLARSGWFWGGVTATATGLIVMYRGGIGTTSTSTFGMLILLGCAAFWGLYSVLVRRHLHGYSARLSFGIMSIYSAPLVLGVMFWLGDWRQVLNLSGLQWFLLWLSAVAGIALGHAFFYQAIHTLGPITSEGGLLLIPFITAVLAYAFIGEHLTSIQWMGGLVLILGSCFLLLAKALVHRRMRQKEEELLIEGSAD
jgi:drug/metabolite transporter (DMT)-like permease